MTASNAVVELLIDTECLKRLQSLRHRFCGRFVSSGPCPFVVLADPQLFEHVDTQEIFNCTEGMVFNETECTCVVDGLGTCPTAGALRAWLVLR